MRQALRDRENATGDRLGPTRVIRETHEATRAPGTPPSAASLEARSDAPNDLLVSSRQVRARIGGITPMCLWRWRRDGKFPDPVRINGRNYWRDNEIRGWIAAQSAGEPRDAVASGAAPC